MTQRGTDQFERLEVQFNGGVERVTATGAWSHLLSRRGFIGAGAAALLLPALAACGDDDSSGGGGAGGDKPGAGKTIALSLNGYNVYNLCLTTGAMKALEGTGYKLIAAQADFTARNELPNIENLLAQQPAGLIVEPVTVQGSSRGALKAQSLDVPAVNTFWSGETPGDSAYIGVLNVDNKKGGELIGEYLDGVGAGGKVLIVEGVPGQGTSEQITAGIESTLGDGWTIAAREPGFFQRSTAIDVTQRMLTAHPDAKAIVTYAAEMGAGVASYLQETGKKDIVHVTSDANLELAKWMEAGLINADRYLSPAQTGTMSITMLRDFVERDEKPSKFLTFQPQQMIAKDDLAPSEGGTVINPDLKPASGYIAYKQYMRPAKQLVS